MRLKRFYLTDAQGAQGKIKGTTKGMLNYFLQNTPFGPR